MSGCDPGPLPILIHDTVIFKNIENDSVSRLVLVYLETAKHRSSRSTKSTSMAPKPPRGSSSIRFFNSTVKTFSTSRIGEAGLEARVTTEREAIGYPHFRAVKKTCFALFGLLLDRALPRSSARRCSDEIPEMRYAQPTGTRPKSLEVIMLRRLRSRTRRLGRNRDSGTCRRSSPSWVQPSY